MSIAQTPTRNKTCQTPSKSIHPAVVDPYDSPSIVRRLQFTPSRRAFVGPTPQRDGKVLGLFDLLDEEERTPVKRRTGARVSEDVQPIQLQTPRKKVDEEFVTPLRHGRTPMSSGRRYLLNTIVTPAKRKSPEAGLDVTPAFLRRGGQWLKTQRYDENGEPEFDSPVAIRLPVKPRGKTLSTLIADLRKLGDERLDDDLDVLRDIENEAAGGKSQSDGGNAQGGGRQTEPQTEKADADAPPAASTKLDQAPSRGAPDTSYVRKKKGAKRTTKRATSKHSPRLRLSNPGAANPLASAVRPSRVKPKPFADINPLATENAVTAVDDDDGGYDDPGPPFGLNSVDDGNAPTNKSAAISSASPLGEPASDAADDDTDPSNQAQQISQACRPSKAAITCKASKSHSKARPTSSTAPAEKKQKKKARKALVPTDANFRRLKLRNRNSRAKRVGGGGGRRFGGGGGGGGGGRGKGRR